MSRSNYIWLIVTGLPWLIAVDSGGCASADSCMRNTDCAPGARCILGACKVPPPETGGAAGASDGGAGAAGHSNLGGNSNAGAAGSAGASGNAGDAGNGGASGSST